MSTLPPDEHEALSYGTPVGRYVVLDRIAAGGMGLVYAAYDPDLDRKIAIKVLRGDLSGDYEGRLRILREAQALAKLSHPNVVNVHDVGTLDDGLFIAMEIVKGRTLGRHIEERGLEWREIVRLFTAAGGGLAAAHQAGLVHRDFKPDNVIIAAEDERPRIVDFGLARVVAHVDEEEALAAEAAGAGAGDEKAHGTLLGPLAGKSLFFGTPAYMAPEQLRGEPDARSDQFAFCASLYECLFRTLPYRHVADEPTRYDYSKPVEPPRKPAVPRRIRRALLRGLSESSEDRYPSMAALLDELSAVLSQTRRVLATAAVILVAAVAAFAIWRGTGGDEVRVCAASDDRVADGVWTDARRTEIRSAFAATKAPFAAKAADAAMRVLDAYALRWVAKHTEICEATHVRHEQSAELLDLRMHCMDRSLDALHSAGEVLADADRRVVEKAADIVYDLPRLEDCDRVDELRRRVPLPVGDEAREKLADAESRLARAEVLLEAGKSEEALSLVEQVIADARAIGYLPLEARALYARAGGLRTAGKSDAVMPSYHLAAQAAEAAHDDVLKARIWISLGSSIGFYRGKLSNAERWLAYARAIVGTTEHNEELRARLLFAEGFIAFRSGDCDRSSESLQQALALFEALPDGDPLLRGLVYGGLGGCAILRDQYDEAGAYYEKARAIVAETRGTDHPAYAQVLNDAGRVDFRLGRIDEARAAYEQAIEIWESAHGPDYPKLYMPLYNLASIELQEERYEDALPLLERSVSVWRASRGADNPGLARPLGRLGLAHSLLGRHRKAREHLERAVEIWAKSDSPKNAIFASGFLRPLGEVEIALGNPDRGFEHLERALRVAAADAIDAENRGMVRFALARALWEAGREKKRALALARAALEDLRAVAVATSDREEVERWLAEHGE